MTILWRGLSTRDAGKKKSDRLEEEANNSASKDNKFNFVAMQGNWRGYRAWEANDGATAICIS